jgi:transposase
MADTYDRVFRERAVAAYESSDGGVHPVSKMLGIGYRTLQRWLAQDRATGSLAPRPRGGGWKSGINMERLTRLVREVPDSTIPEFCAEYNRRVSRAKRTSVSAVRRAMKRLGFVLKKNGRGRPKRIARTSRPNATRSSSG